MSYKKVLGSFTLSLILVSAILSMREYPLMASVGWQSLFFYAIAAFTFLIPSAIVCATLAVEYPSNGGIYAWVREAFGDKLGFLAIWMEWINNVISFPATLATIVATLAYAGLPILATNKYLLFALILIIYWGLTLYNLYGIKLASRLNVVGALGGTLLPSGLIIVLGLIWFFSYYHPVMVLTGPAVPDMNFNNMALFVGVLSAYAGMQIIAFHAQNVKTPKRSFPLSMAVATIIIVSVSILASLSIALVVPHAQLNVINGVEEALSVLANYFHMGWLSPLFAGLIAFGMMASLSAWILGPARGLQRAAYYGQLPKTLARVNQQAMPKNVMLLQGVITTGLTFLFLFMSDLKSAFILLIALTSQFTVLMYILVFAAAIKLHINSKKLKWLLPPCLLGIVACLVGFIVGLFPPQQVSIYHPKTYFFMLVMFDFIILGVPIVMLVLKSSGKKTQHQ